MRAFLATGDRMAAVALAREHGESAVSLFRETAIANARRQLEREQ